MKKKTIKIVSILIILILITSLRFTINSFAFELFQNNQTPLQNHLTGALQEGEVELDPYIIEAKYNHKGRTYLNQGESTWDVPDVKTNENNESEEINPPVTFGTGGTIKELMDFLNDEDFDKPRGHISTGLKALRTFPSFFCLKAGQAIGRYHSYLTIDHGVRYIDISDYVTTNTSSFASYSGTIDLDFDRNDYLDMVIESDHTSGSCADGHHRATAGIGGATFGILTNFIDRMTNYVSYANERLSKLNALDYTETVTEGLELSSNVSEALVGGGASGGQKPSGGGTPPTTENYNTRYVYTNVHYWEEYTNIYTINNKFGTYYTNVFAYAASFSEKLNYLDQSSNRYNQERAQNAIWGVVGDPSRGESDTTEGTGDSGSSDSDVNIDELDTHTQVSSDVEYSEADYGLIMNSRLFECGRAVDQYEALLTKNISGNKTEKHHTAIVGTDPELLNQPKVLINAEPDSDVFEKEKIGTNEDSTGTTLFEKNGELYYKVGPFTMNDYALAFAKNRINIEQFSGQNLNKYKQMLGGIVEGYVTFETEAGAEIVVEIGKNNNPADPTEKVEITYFDMIESDRINKGDGIAGNTDTSVYIRTPSEDEYDFPYPNSTFYITIKRSAIINAVKLTKFTFNYRQTRTDGRGWVISSKYFVTKWQRIGQELSSETYYCSTPDGGWGSPDTSDVGDYQSVTYRGKCPDAPFNCPCGGHWVSTGTGPDGSPTGYTEYRSGCHCSCPGHERTGKGYFRCGHGHTECWHFDEWQLKYSGVAKGQTFLAIRDAYTAVVKTPVKTKLNVRLTTDLRVNKYIYDVEHYEDEDDPKTVRTGYDSTKEGNDEREKLRPNPVQNEQIKESNPVYVEYGDIVTYKIRLQNYQGEAVELKIKDTLPEGCELLSIRNDTKGEDWSEDNEDYVLTKVGTPGNYSVHKFSTNWIEVAKGTETNPGTTDILVKVMVLTWEAAHEPWENEVHIITNNAGYKEGDEDNVDYMRTVYENEDRPGPVVNLAELDDNKLTSSSDWYTLNDYNLTMDKYIVDYESPISEFNEAQKFTQNEKIEVPVDDKGISRRYEMSEQDKYDRPFPGEKKDTIYYELRLTNDAVDKPSPNGVASGLKKATQIRPNEISDKMHVGLKFISVKARIVDEDNNDVVDTVPVTYTNVGNNTYKFTIPDFDNGEYVLVDPGEAIVYTVEVEIIESNMYLERLDNEAFYNIMTNINDNTETLYDRVIYKDDGTVDENISDQEISREYIKMKDLVIAGRVWLDTNKDGFMGKNKDGALGAPINVADNPAPSTYITEAGGDTEYPMQNIVVRLYKIENGAGEGELYRTTKTDENGMFTFGRQEDMSYYPGTYAYYELTNPVTESEQRVPKANNKDNNLNYTESSTLIEYYIEYEYDGILYKSTEIYSNDSNINADGTFVDDYKIDSNAFEFIDVREEFNTRYEIIAFNKGYKGDLTTCDYPDLEYEKRDHISYIRVNKDRVMTSRSFVTEKLKTKSKQNTKLLWLFEQQSTELPETEYLKFINLGLEEREDVDISITHDVYQLRTTINGEQMSYQYNQNEHTLDGRTDGTTLDFEQDPSATSFDSEKYMTGYDLHQSDDSTLTNKEWYKFEYFLEDYNYRISQYHINTVRDYKGSPLRQGHYSDLVVDNGRETIGASMILDNLMTQDGSSALDPETGAYITGRESELNTEVWFRIRVTNNPITNDEPFLPNFDSNAQEDIKIFTGINEIVEYYSEDFVDFRVDNGQIVGFNVKTKDENDYLINTEMKIMEAMAYLPDGTEVPVTLSDTSPYNTTRHIAGYDTLFITPTDQTYATNVLTGGKIKAGKLILGEGESLDIKIKFVVEKEAETPANIELEEVLGIKENVAEISAYSTYYKVGETDYKSASLVDKDSNPGNFGETYGASVDDDGYIRYFEDDTFMTGILLRTPTTTDETGIPRAKQYVERTLIGHVWDDARTNTATDNNGTQYIGDGRDESKDPESSRTRADNNISRKNSAVSNGEATDISVKDVEAKLVEQIRIPVYNDGDPKDRAHQQEERIYEDTIYVNDDSVMEARTDASGDYMLSGYIPGEYIVKFTYGDVAAGEDVNTLDTQRVIFNGQDYKSTTYQATESVVAENAQPQGDKTAGDVKLEILEHAGSSDARDDEIRRLEVIGYSETMNNERNEILKGIHSSNRQALLNNTWMFAETPDFLVRTEKEIRKVTILTYLEHNTKVTETITQSRFRVKNIDFGLQYRPELQLSINKFISNITLTTSDSTGVTKAPIVDAIFDEVYGVVKETDYLTGSTSFCTYIDDEGVSRVVRVNPNDSTDEITNKLAEHGINGSNITKNNDGTYILAIAGTELNYEKSVGLTNLQYLPNEYEVDSNGKPVITPDGDKYIVHSTQGFAYIVVDDDIMQGATIKIRYLFSGTNLGEIDRVSSNLSDLRFKENAETRKYDRSTGDGSSYYEEYNYQVGNDRNALTLINQNYSASKTARNALFSEYYRYELNDAQQINKDLTPEANDVLYKVKPKHMRASSRMVEIPDVSTTTTTGTNPTVAAHTDTQEYTPVLPLTEVNTYYGRYLGSTYYTGIINNQKDADGRDLEVVAELKIDKILDYIDNDLVFNNDDNRGDDNLWKTSTASELYGDGMLNVGTYKYYENGTVVTDNNRIQAQRDTLEKKLLDAKGRAYNTGERSNLAISLDDRVRDDYELFGLKDTTVNQNFTHFLIPRYCRENSTDSFGTIYLHASKVLSPEDENDDMVYENIAEVIQYSSVTGRVTNLATTIGNAKIENISGKTESKPNLESPEYYEGRTESDTASVEKITLTPPTGLDRLHRTVRNVVEGASYSVAVIIAVILVCVAVMVIIKKYHSRRIK